MQSAAPLVKRILIQCPSIVPTTHPELDACHYETVDDVLFLRIWVGKGRYTVIQEDRDLKYQRTLTTPIAPLSSAVVGFKITSDTAIQSLRNAVQHISLLCRSPDLTTHTPLRVLDFCEPDWRDRVLYNDEYYTQRIGRIRMIEPKGSTIGLGLQNYSDGFELEFEELEKRSLVG